MENSEIIVRLGLAILLGMVIGFERLLGHKEAGMKTHAMVSMGAALFIIISEALAAKYADIGGFDASRMASQIIVGIGFMGAGSIIFQGNRLKGLTTASGFWVTAGIGMAAGFGLFNLAVLTTVFVLLIFVFISMVERPVINMVEKRDHTDDKLQ
ncbi:MAG: MgtC/SapB family protein [Candidatus Pacebacteria bacterium]|nr:MgtC/SapB family protein [Candidatus Paceibacterota bacterium]MBP9851372.1 MgtC/SapB family protein [Candidatus Paceibacterota bacterium]